MPLHAPPAGVIRLTISGTYDGSSKWANVFHLNAPSADVSSSTQLHQLADDVEDAFDNAGLYDGSKDSFGANLMRLVASDGANLFNWEQVVTTLSGTDTNEYIAGGSAAVISWKGAWHYRGGKPRTYIGGLTDEWFLHPYQLNGAYTVPLQTAAFDLITNIGELDGAYGNDVELGVLIGNTAAAAGVFHPFTGAQVTQQVGSQRRRNRAS